MQVISIEGIDGTGKTTLLKGLERYFERGKYCYVSFPTEEFYSEYKKIDRSGMTDEEYYTKVNQLQKLNKETIYKEKKEDGYEIMFCDRFEVSQRVYDGMNVGDKDVGEFEKESDLVIYLSMEVDDVLKRVKDRGVEDVLGYEKKNTLIKVKKRYESILEQYYKGRMCFVDVTGKGSTEVLQEVIFILDDQGYIE